MTRLVERKKEQTSETSGKERLLDHLEDYIGGYIAIAAAMIAVWAIWSYVGGGHTNQEIAKPRPSLDENPGPAPRP
jgi:hypothetical protein